MGAPQEEKGRLSFQAVYHPSVHDDLASIHRDLQALLETTIATRLCRVPQAYSQPLRGHLSGYWKLRVGDYRVVFKVVNNEVWIFGIIHRKDVYSHVVKRLRWSPPQPPEKA